MDSNLGINSIDVLSLDSNFTMDQLRQQRELLMTQRMDLIERHRKLSNRIMVKPFLQTAQPPTPPPVENVQSFASSWIKNLLVGLVYDAVREVEVSRPNRQKLKYYTAISKDYETLVERLISKSIKQSVVTEMFEVLWKEVTLKEIKLIVKQCVGDMDISGSLASSLILQSIIQVNKFNNQTDHVQNELEMCKNLMSEICMERNKRKDDRFFHRLHLSSIIEHQVADDGVASQQDSELQFDGQVLSALRIIDIQCLERMYLPVEFEEYLSAEIWLWKHIAGEPMELPLSSAILASTISNSMKYAAISMKNYILVLRCDDNSLVGKIHIEVAFGDCIHISWLDNEQDIIATSSHGKVFVFNFFGSNTKAEPTTAKKSSRLPTSSNVLELKSSFDGVDLRLSQGSFAQADSDNSIRHFPVQVFPAPIYTVSGDQPIFLVVCQNFEILRVCFNVDDIVLLPDDIQQFNDIANLADNGAKLDICKGHDAKILQIVFKDEYTFYSFDERCCIIEWEYSHDCFDAYGYVIPKKYLVQGNDMDYLRLVKGLVSNYNAKGGKTRQEVMQAAKIAENEFIKIGYSKKPTSSRENTESGLIEKTYVKSVNLSYELEVMGTVVVNKVIGRSLVAMKSQMFKLRNCKPSQLLGVSVSPCRSIVAYCFIFLNPLYGVQPYLSVILLNTHGLVFLKNKIKMPLTAEQAQLLKENSDTFAFCISPPHCLTKSAYLFIKIDKSVLIVSTATSSIIRTTLDLSRFSADNAKYMSKKNTSCLQGGTISCAVWGKYLVVYGDLSKSVLAFSLSAPEDLEGRPLFFKRYHKCHHLADLIDPDRKRLLVQSKVTWGAVNELPHDSEHLFDFLKNVLLRKLYDKFALLATDGTTAAE